MELNRKTYTVESVLNGHPDKICDQISDAILDAYLSFDKNSHVAIECLGCGDNLFIGGEVSNISAVDIENTALHTYRNIGYDNSLMVHNFINKQSEQLNSSVLNGGAGDQGIVYGYAVNNNFNYLPYGVYIANKVAKSLDEYKRANSYLKSDGKVQVTIDSDTIINLTISIQHTQDAIIESVRKDIKNLISSIIDVDNTIISINNNSRFINGGFINDTGLTGRKIMVDTYGGIVNHGGGAFSGKDPSKIDRSAAYMARFIAKNIVANGLEPNCEISIAYTFGDEQPIMIMARTNDKDNPKLRDYIKSRFDFRPKAIIELLDLYQVKYLPTATYGHFTNPNYNWEKLISL